MRTFVACAVALSLGTRPIEAVRLGEDDVVEAVVSERGVTELRRDRSREEVDTVDKIMEAMFGIRADPGKGKKKEEKAELKSEGSEDNPEANKEAEKGWELMVKQVKESGGEINSKVAMRMMKHGGFFARGIVATDDIKKGERLVRIPKSMWVHIDNYPDFQEKGGDCGWYSTEVGTGLAREILKGNSSNWYAYIQNLPTRDDFERFYPRWAKDDLLEHFEGLPFVAELKKLKVEDQNLRTCWEKWSKQKAKKEKKTGKKTKPNLGKLTWKEMELAFAWWRSRNYGFGYDRKNKESESALIPAADFMNTSPSKDFNTRWTAESSKDNDDELDFFAVYAKKDTKAGTEFYESYCADCKNSDLLETWGIYMEDNVKKEDKLGRDVCSKIWSKAVDALEPAATKASSMTAPRCKKTTLEDKQGPLKCSLARLAFEACEDVLEEGKGKQ